MVVSRKGVGSPTIAEIFSDIKSETENDLLSAGSIIGQPELTFAFQCKYISSTSERRASYGAYAPLIMQDRSILIRDQITEKMLNLWASFLAEDLPSLVEARLSDLIWISGKHSDGHNYARRARYFFENGDSDAGVHILIPRVERVMRSLVQKLGGVTTKGPRGDAPGGVIGMGSLLDELKTRTDTYVYRYLKAILCEVEGINMRNRVAHGLIENVSKAEYALLLHVLFLLDNLGRNIRFAEGG